MRQPFKKLTANTLDVGGGLVVTIEYRAPVGAENIQRFYDEVIPLLAQAPVMAEVLRQIATDDYSGAFTFLDKDFRAPLAIEVIKGMARRAIAIRSMFHKVSNRP